MSLGHRSSCSTRATASSPRPTPPATSWWECSTPASGRRGKSIDDTGFGPVPAGWKSACKEGKDFKATFCNRKLIGARYFSKGYEARMGPIDESRESRSPRDIDGHGTRTSSTAAGSAMTDASLLGFATGTARGMATWARVAAYKVCWAGGWFSSDILAAMDKAVDDGCHVLSLSLGGGMSDYYSVPIGAFNAMEKGVLVSCSAGNAGPSASSLSNVAPWTTTVGAGTLDQDFPAYVVLGNGKNDATNRSFAVAFATTSGNGGGVEMVKHTRTMTNVGEPGTYKATVATAVTGGEVKVAVEPADPRFKKEGGKQSYTVSFSAPSPPSESFGFGRLEWSDGKHVVANPIAFAWTVRTEKNADGD
ncbi:hypothetical protein COCNU_03G000630 [Cocos nucifera]|uniref:Uncharacterized protein n=1 Tax=Cocos nucifera TaxID=13894 RepID=A0A8K0MY28_COCNU|nr:hypothetical protein COCNU_03G000630 [Cocos nucifera]